MFAQLAVLSSVLGVAAFTFGLLPLTVSFSENHIERLSALGTGLLLGAGLGVIIPEGIESLIKGNPGTEVPTTQIALSLLVGFILMLALEQLAIPSSHHIEHNPGLPVPFKEPQSGVQDSHLEFDAELDDLEHLSIEIPNTPTPLEVGSSGRQRAFAFTVGLVIHSIADGLALGVSALATGATNNVSLVVFLALLLHKAPTSLALTTSLLSLRVPKSECKKYVAAFSAATPSTAIVVYTLLTLFGIAESSGWTGIALLVSGGSFLYVATVLQPVSHQSKSAQAMKPTLRVILIVVGMLVPFTLSSILGHGH